MVNYVAVLNVLLCYVLPMLSVCYLCEYSIGKRDIMVTVVTLCNHSAMSLSYHS
jgi:hypothetical protein